MTDTTPALAESPPSSRSQDTPAAPGRLRALWVLFFFQFAAVGVYFTFLNVYYKQAGLSGAQIGFIGMASGIAGIAGSFVWGYLSDRTGRHREFIAVGAVGALLVAQLIPLVALARLPDPFAVYVVLGCVGGLMTSSTSALVDSTALALLGSNRQAYGRYRLGGSVGYIVATVVSGFVFDLVGYLWMFPAYGLLMACFGFAALRLPRRDVHLSGTGRHEIGSMIRQPDWLILIGSVFLLWIAYFASMQFMGIVLKSMGASDPLIAVAAVIGAVVELPFMAYSGPLIQRFGPARLLWFSILLQAIRFALLSQMQAPAWALVINLLNGPGFVLFWNSALILVARLAPPGLAATAQGFFASTISLAGLLGASLGGVLLDQLGPGGLYLILTAFCLASGAVFGLGIVARPRRLGHS